MKLQKAGNPALRQNQVSTKDQDVVCMKCGAEFTTDGGEANGPCRDLFYTIYAREGRRTNLKVRLSYYGWLVECPECKQVAVAIWFPGEEDM